MINRLLSLTILIFSLSILSCGEKNKNMTPSEIGNSITSKWEKQIELTPEQKATIVSLTESIGVMKEGVRNSEDKAKFEALREKVYNDVLTPEQRTKVNLNKDEK